MRTRRVCPAIVFVVAPALIAGCVPPEVVATSLVLDGEEDYGVALYDFDVDGRYEIDFKRHYRGDEHFPALSFHVTATRPWAARSVTAFVNDPADPLCRAAVTYSERNMKIETNPMCTRGGENRLVMRVRYPTGKTTTANLTYDLLEDEDYEAFMPACDSKESLRGKDGYPCSALDGQCVRGRYVDAEHCCTGEMSADGTPCEDGDSETFGDRCVDGKCLGKGTIDDEDADGIRDEEDPIIGDALSLDSSLPGPALKIEEVGGANERTYRLTVYSNGDPVAEFTKVIPEKWDVMNSPPSLHLSDVLVDAGREEDLIGFAILDIDVSRYERLQAPGHDSAKHFYPPWIQPADTVLYVRQHSDKPSVCISRVGVRNLSEIHADCSGPFEERVACAAAQDDKLQRCEISGSFLKVTARTPAVVWEIIPGESFVATPIHSLVPSVISDRIWAVEKGVILCADLSGPDCSDTYCSPGLDPYCHSAAAICSWGTGPCSRVQWPDHERPVPGFAVSMDKDSSYRHDRVIAVHVQVTAGSDGVKLRRMRLFEPEMLAVHIDVGWPHPIDPLGSPWLGAGEEAEYEILLPTSYSGVFTELELEFMTRSAGVFSRVILLSPEVIASIPVVPTPPVEQNGKQ